VHDFRPKAITIAEDVSGMPGMCNTIDDGGVGFDYRLGMAIPDFWIKMLKDTPDEEWNIWEMWSLLTNRLPEVKTVAYAESHDQALVGDKTIAFRLLDKLMYDSMDRACENIDVDRGMALHKMIRLITIAAGGDAYLNFMGNEFGHPEWIDFPREGNGWSYNYARRQWSLRDNGFLRYALLADFDKAMIKLIKKYHVLSNGYPYNLQMDEQNKTMVFSHGDLIFIFNWHPTASIADYELPVHVAGKYEVILSTDEKRYGGFARQALGEQHFTFNVEGEDGEMHPRMKIYNTSRTATVLRRVD
jgi:1,4-alpha-glucan branching enzyme